MFKYHKFMNRINDLCFQTILSFCLLTFISLVINYLITCFTLLYNYPDLQPINTYHSLIGVVYLCMHCVWICPRHPKYSDCLLNPRVSKSSLYIYHCLTVRVLIIILWRFLGSQFNWDIVFDTLCLRFLILPSPCLFWRNSDSWFWHSDNG